MDIWEHMERDSFTKKYNFRLPDRTIEQLEVLIGNGVIQNRTDGVILAIDRLYNSEKHAQAELEAFDLILRSVAKYPELYEVWKNIQHVEDNKS